MMVWDLGKYEPLENQPPEEQLVRGKIHIVLLGEKLRGAGRLAA
jgi:bifunctional non-homologous end joining protein LigD